MGIKKHFGKPDYVYKGDIQLRLFRVRYGQRVVARKTVESNDKFGRKLYYMVDKYGSAIDVYFTEYQLVTNPTDDELNDALSELRANGTQVEIFS